MYIDFVTFTRTFSLLLVRTPNKTSTVHISEASYLPQSYHIVIVLVALNELLTKK